MTTYYLIVRLPEGEYGYSFAAESFAEATRIGKAFVEGHKRASNSPMHVDSLSTRKARGVTYEAL